jgi:hypothetical protein
VDTDPELPRRYFRTRDPESFAQLAQRYAGYVFGTSLRITGKRHDAEDVTQGCFLELARDAAAVESSLASWLPAPRGIAWESMNSLTEMPLAGYIVRVWVLWNYGSGHAERR